MIEGKELYNLVLRVITGCSSTSDQTRLVRVCVALASAYLRYQQYSQRLYFSVNTRENGELRDMSVDVVAPLFARDEKGCFIYLKRYFEPLLTEMEQNQDCCLQYLRRLVVSKTKQELIRYFRREDPSGWNIYRNLQLAPERNDHIGVFEDLHRLYFYYRDPSVTLNVPSDLQPQRPEVEFAVLENWLQNVVHRTNKVPELMEQILSDLSQSREYRLFVSRVKLFRCLRSVTAFKIVFIDQDQYYAHEGNGGMVSPEWDPTLVLGNLLRFLEGALKRIYLDKAKLTSLETTTYREILRTYFSDLLNGHLESLPKYLNRSCAAALMGDNFAKHKNRLEYLIKLGKQELRNEWEENIFPSVEKI